MPDPVDPAVDPAAQPDPWLEALAQANVPEQFRTPEAIGSSWREAQRNYTQAQQEISALQSQLSEALTEQQQYRQPQPAYDPSADPLVIAHQRAFEEGDSQSMLAIQIALTQQAIQQAVQGQQAPPSDNTAHDELWADAVENRVRRQMGDDWDMVRERALERAGQYEQLFPDGISVERGAKILADFAEAEKNRMLIERSTLGNQQQQALGRQQKVLAQGLQGQGARQNGAPAVSGKEAFTERFKSVPGAFGVPTS